MNPDISDQDNMIKLIYHDMRYHDNYRLTLESSNLSVSKFCLLGYKLPDKTRQIPTYNANLVTQNCHIL